ncbi:MAG: hypothetical protein WAS50_13050 [Nitrospira sp.]
MQIADKIHRMFVYVLSYDTGFAPNPQDGYCTLACCKPRIRESAEVGDWIAGITPAELGQPLKLCYAMKVTENPITFADYHNEKRFLGRCDQIYRPINGGRYQQIPNSFHSEADLLRDTHVDRVLISSHYWYFGGDYVDLPADMIDGELFKGGRGHRVTEKSKTIGTFESWLLSISANGVHGVPRKPVLRLHF